jgi:hypothetical protein
VGMQFLRMISQMKEITDNKITFLKSMGIWILFLIASVKTLELFVDNYYLLMLLFPGLLVFGFFIYYSIKTARLLIFWRYFIAVITLTTLFLLSIIVIFTYLRLYYDSNALEILLLMAAACILIPISLYWLTRLIIRINKR